MKWQKQMWWQQFHRCRCLHSDSRAHNQSWLGKNILWLLENFFTFLFFTIFLKSHMYVSQYFSSAIHPALASPPSSPTISRKYFLLKGSLYSWMLTIPLTPCTVSLGLFVSHDLPPLLSGWRRMLWLSSAHQNDGDKTSGNAACVHDCACAGQEW